MNLDLSKGKKRMVLQILLYNYYYCNFIVTFLILVACQAIKPQHIVGLLSFKLPLANRVTANFKP